MVATGGEHAQALVSSGLPENARVERFIPFERILPHVDVLVTNGGYGGVQAALRHGVPLVVAGRTEEKAETAARIRWSGVGIDLRTSTPRPRALRCSVGRVLRDPHYAQRARSMRKAMKTYDAVQSATGHIEQLAARPKERVDGLA